MTASGTLADAATDLMPGVVYAGPGRIEVATRPVPAVQDPHEVLVRVVATGVCGTDRAIALGEFPARPGVVLGHETVGDVLAVGPGVRHVSPGDRVVVNPTFYCGQCDRCRRGRAAHCLDKDGREMGIDRDGSMAPLTVAHERFVHRLPAGLPYRRAALIEPLACVLANVEAAAPRWDDLVLVAGAGPIGVLAALVLTARGVRVRVAERDATRVRLARETLPGPVPVVSGVHLREATDGGRRPDAVIDTTGYLLAEAVDLVEAGGTVVMMGERQGARATIGARALATRGIRVVGAGPYPPHLFEVAVGLAERLPIDCVVTHEVPLARAVEAWELLGVPVAGREPVGYRAGKVLLVPDGWSTAG